MSAYLCFTQERKRAINSKSGEPELRDFSFDFSFATHLLCNPALNMALNEAKKKIKLFAKRQAIRLKVLFIVEFLRLQ